MNPLPYFVVDSRKRSDGRYRIYIRQNTKPATMIPTAYFLDKPSEFKKGMPKDLILKNSLNALMKSLFDIERKLGGASTLKECWDIYQAKPSMSPYVRDWVILPMRHQIEKFDSKWKLSDLTIDKLAGYFKHLKAETLRDTTIGNHIAELKRAGKLAKRKSLEVPDELFEFKPKLRQALPKESLNWIELMKLLNLSRDPALDMFLLECFTGIRYSDLTEELQINETHILFRQKKTGKVAAPALNPIAKSIIMRNSVVDIEDGRRKFVPHRRKIQTINRRLKDIAEAHGIKKNLSTHIGRHSYAKLLADLGIPEGVRAIQLGHKPVGNTQRYGLSSDYEFASQLVLKAFQRAMESKAKTYEQWLMDINPIYRDIYSKAV